MQVISYKSIPRLMTKSSRNIKIAGMKTLNTIAFDSLPEIVDQAASDMNFRRAPRPAMGMRVKTARLSKIEAVIASNRGWLKFHVEEGTRRAKEGWRFNGQRYLVVPVEKGAFTAKGRMKAKYKRNLYVIPDGTDALVFHRARRSSKGTLIATLEREVKFHEDTKPERVVREVFLKKANRLFNFHLRRLG